MARRRLGGVHGFMGRTGPGARTSALVFAVLFVHSLPEGLAIGTAFASDRPGLSLFVILAMALQNIPEGTSVAIPMNAARFSRPRQFWAAVGTSSPQPVGALIAFAAVEQVNGLLPFSFAFAAGRCFPSSQSRCCLRPTPGAADLAPASASSLGAAVMLALSLLLGVWIAGARDGRARCKAVAMGSAIRTEGRTSASARPSPWTPRPRGRSTRSSRCGEWTISSPPAAPGSRGCRWQPIRRS